MKRHLLFLWLSLCGALLLLAVPSACALERMALDKTSYLPGQYLAVSCRGVTREAVERGAWVGVARAGDPASSYLSWKYVPQGDSTLWLPTPNDTGHYEVRFYQARSASEENLAGSPRAAFTVIGQRPDDDTPVYPEANDFDWSLLTFTPSRESWTGVYDTSYKTMYLRQDGNEISGEYPEWDNGRVDGYVEDGIFYGYWYESPTYAPSADAGQLICALYPDGQGFQGWWRCGNNGGWSEWSAGTLRMPTVSSWAEAEVNEAAARNLIPACLEGTDLTQGISAVEFAALGVRLFEEYWQIDAIPQDTPFADVPGHPLQAEIEKAYGLGFLKLIRAEALGENGLTRQLMAQMLCCLVKVFDEDNWTFETDDQFPLIYDMPQPYADDDKIFRSARDSVYYCAANGLLEPMADNAFSPSSAATREAAIVAMNRIYSMELAYGEDWEDDFDLSLELSPLADEPADIVPQAAKRLVNGDASDGLFGWTDPDGIWTTRSEYEGQVTPCDGPFFMPNGFKTGYGDRTRIYQDVSVAGCAGMEGVYSAYVRTWDTNNTDETLLTVEYLDAAGRLLDEASVTSANDPVWHPISVTATVPSGAVTARLSLYAVYWYGSECDSYFDRVSFELRSPASSASDPVLNVPEGALAAGRTLRTAPLSPDSLGDAGQVFSPVEITGEGYDGAFFGADIALTLQAPDLQETDLGRYVFGNRDERTGALQYYWPDGYDRSKGVITLNLPHLSPWWGKKLSEKEQIEAFLEDYSTRLAISQSQEKQAAAELEPYVRAKVKALGLTAQAAEDLIQSTVNFLGGQFQGEYKDAIETGTKAVTSVTRGVLDNDTDSMRSGLEDAVNGAIMHGWDELNFTERIDQVLGSEFAGSTASKLAGSANGVARMAGYLAEGDLSGAAEELGGVMQNVHPSVELVTKGARFLAAAGDTAFTYWKSSQVEALYQVYKHGAKGLFGNEVIPQDRQSFLTFLNTSSGFTMAKGVKRFYNLDKIGEVCERYGWDFKTYSELPERYRDIFEKRAEDGLMQYFETRLKQEAAAEKIKAEERACVEEMLNPFYGALHSDNYKHFFGEDGDGKFDVTARLERLVKVRQFISQYVNEEELNRPANRDAGYNYGTLLNEWVSLASRYKKQEAIRKFCEYLKELGFLKDGMLPKTELSLEEQLRLLQGDWNDGEVHHFKNTANTSAPLDFYNLYLVRKTEGEGTPTLDEETGDLVITFKFKRDGIKDTVLRFHFVDDDHVEVLNVNSGKTKKYAREK